MALHVAGDWRGALILGPSGSGKSDLGLCLIGAGWRLVADDRTRVWSSGGRLFGRAPDVLLGLIEARGVGVLSMPALPLCEVPLAIRIDPRPDRLPEDERELFEGVSVPVMRLASFEASGPVKVALRMQALARLGSRD